MLYGKVLKLFGGLQKNKHKIISAALVAFVLGIAIGTWHVLILQKIVLLLIFAALGLLLGGRKNMIYAVPLLFLLFGFGRGYVAPSRVRTLPEPNRVQTAVSANLVASFGTPEAYLAAALIAGDKKNLPKNIKNNFRDAGLAHLLAVSGYNVALLVGGIGGLLRGRVSKRAEFIILVAAVTSFVLISGAKAPVIRAGLMGGLAALALKAGRQNAGSRALLLAVVIMLAINPNLLFFDVGFELSVAATAGILFFGPVVRKKLRGITEFAGLRTNLSTAVAANVAVLPLVTVFFLKLPTYALLANILVVPFIPVIMLLGFLGALLGGHLAGVLVGWLGGGLAELVLWITGTIAGLPGASVVVTNLPLFLSLEIIVLLIFIWSLSRKSIKKQKNLLL